MLLSNMSKLDSVSLQILNLRVPFSVAPSPSASTSATPDKADEHVEKAARKSPAVEDEILALDLLLEVHLKGEGKKYNPNANYDFLASVFANISLVSVVSAIRSVPARLTISRSELVPSRSSIPSCCTRRFRRASPLQTHLLH